MSEIIEYYKYKVGTQISFYKHFVERGYAIHLDVSKDRINRIASSTLISHLGLKRSKKKIQPVWSDTPVYVTTRTTEKLYNFHFENVVKILRE